MELKIQAVNLSDIEILAKKLAQMAKLGQDMMYEGEVQDINLSELDQINEFGLGHGAECHDFFQELLVSFETNQTWQLILTNAIVLINECASTDADGFLDFNDRIKEGFEALKNQDVLEASTAAAEQKSKTLEIEVEQLRDLSGLNKTAIEAYMLHEDDLDNKIRSLRGIIDRYEDNYESPDDNHRFDKMYFQAKKEEKELEFNNTELAEKNSDLLDEVHTKFNRIVKLSSDNLAANNEIMQLKGEIEELKKAQTSNG